MRRFPWEWLLALGLGIGFGLYYAWVLAPIASSDITPDTLRADFKDQFRVAIASAYAATGNLDRARARLALLKDPNPVEGLAGQAQRSLAAGAPANVAEHLAMLASDLTSGTSSLTSAPASATPSPNPGPSLNATAALPSASPSAAPPASASASLTGTPLSVLNPTPVPTRTAVPTFSAPFQLVSQEQVCNPNLTSGLMQILIMDGRKQPLPGVEIDLTWATGEERFFTGFKPEISVGYADYVMQADTKYSVVVARSGSPTSGLSAPTCPQTGGKTYLGGLKLTFQQP